LSSLLLREWNRHFVAYEDALASFYALQDATQKTLEQSYVLANRLDGLARLRAPVLAARRRLRSWPDDGRVAEIERARATIDLDGVAMDVTDLAANCGTPDDAVLELSFRVDPKKMPAFVSLDGPVRIRFPYGESTFVAVCRLLRFKLRSQEFAFWFGTVDPV
jgi:hypothetical protein